ncbi:acyltransferase family protein [Vibrio sp. HN007]|uniref:acyltransferase family protein n=1 Tax=Vibrio iocasae TaxID=3098914 RepID=UPI0035D421DF
MKERIMWLDIARGIAFLMIIYRHLDFMNETLMAYFSPMFLTIFFFVSGYLFNTKYSFLEVVEQRFRTVLIPFFIYGIANIILSQILTFGDKPPLDEAFYNFFAQIRGEDDGLWFLACLFVATIPFYFMVKYTKGAGLLSLSIALLLVNYFADLDPVPWHIEFIAPSVFYMSLGYLYKQNETKLGSLDTGKSIIFMAILYIPLVTIHYANFSELIHIETTHYIVDGIVITLLGIHLCIAISKNTSVLSSTLAYIGSNSLLYFCLHGKVLSLLQKVAYSLFDAAGIEITQGISFVLGLVIVLLTAMLLYIPVSIINKYFYWTIGQGFRLLSKPAKPRVA